MNIRILFCLAIVLLMAGGCKKDKSKTYHFTGIVLHQPGNTRVADAEVILQLSYSNPTPSQPYRYTFTSTQTNSNGEYSFSVQDPGNAKMYSIAAKKGDWQQIAQSSRFKGGWQSSGDVNFISKDHDTINLEDASYLQVIVDIKSPVPAYGLSLELESMNDSMDETFTYFPTGRNYSNTKTDTFLFPFSITRYPKARVALYENGPIPTGSKTPVVEKLILPEPYKTTQIQIEY